MTAPESAPGDRNDEAHGFRTIVIFGIPIIPADPPDRSPLELRLSEVPLSAPSAHSVQGWGL